jgi:AcrR family transcriptional regulator
MPAPTSQEDKEKTISAVFALMEKGKDFHASCDEVGVYPTTLYRWFEKDERLGEMYARARDALVHLHSKELIELADRVLADPARSRVQVDTRKWVLSKLMPKTFGDKLAIGGDKENPLQIEHVKVYLPSNGRD